jgi:hypothetical protein
MDSLNITRTGLNLMQGQWYYFSVRAQDGAGLYSTKVFSNGQKVDTTANTTGISQFKMQDLEFKIYPNPAKNFVTVNYTLTQETNIKWQIVDLIGQTILQNESLNLSGKYAENIDITSLSQGLYLFNIIINGQQKTIKLIKEGN